ncbi:hypothetical protein D6745_00035 [Candidatus Woesearchaeota archaeon]|nr:MAG: hypothetical protein D6745_00035 [Candidatus Woesearchaeota archaeon]
MKSKAVVLGLYGANALGVVRSLGYEGIPVVGFHQQGRFPHAAYSKYLEEAHFAESEEGLLEKLVEFGKTQDEKGVLFATGDNYVVFCQHHAEELEPYYHVPLARERLCDLIKKQNLINLGRKAGFLVPQSQYLSEERRIDFPVLAKPVNSLGTSKSDFYVFQSAEEFERIRQQLLEKYGEMVLQQYIPGGVRSNVEVHTYLSTQGPLIAGMLRKLYAVKNSVPGSLGALVETIWEDELLVPSLRITEMLGFKGALDINLKQHAETGKYYFLEVNFRTSANNMLDTVAGLNLPAIIYYDLTGNDISSLAGKKHKIGARWLMENRWLKCLANGDCSPEDMGDVDVLVFFDPKDPLPALMALDETLSFKSA